MNKLGVYNDKLDNLEHNLIVYIDDIIKGPTFEYKILDLLGKRYFVFLFNRLTLNLNREWNFRSSV